MIHLTPGAMSARANKKRLHLPLFGLLAVGLLAPIAHADTTPQGLPFTQNWSNTDLITTNNDWSGVPGIIGYRGDDLTTAIGTDPQTILADGSGTPVNVTANAPSPSGTDPGGGGIFEFDKLTDPVVAFQGSATSDAPHLVITLNTSGQSNVRVRYNLRDVDPTGDATQQVALQYRVGTTGDYVNVPAGYVADASGDTGTATQVTAVDATLPAEANNQAVIQVRVITTNAPGSDQLIGVDDINITGDSGGGGAVNMAPTLDAIGDQRAPQDSGAQTVNLTGITAGTGETQNLTVTATSDNTALIPNPTVTYTSPNTTGTLSFTPVAGQTGTANITVTVMDSGGTANGGVNTFSRTFAVTVSAPMPPTPNVAPKVNPTIAPQNPGTNDIITVTPNGSDADNGPNTLTYTYTFSVNGTQVQTGASNTLDLSQPGFGDAGDTVSVSVVANDGADNSDPGTASVTVAANAPGQINFGVSITPKGPATNQTITATPVINDGTGVTYTYSFSVGSTIVQTGTSNTLDLSQAGFGDKGDVITVVVNAMGTGGASGTASNTVTVVNSAPVAQDSNGSSVMAGQTIAIPLIGTDADGDALTFKRVGGPDNGTAEIRQDTDGQTKLFYTSRAQFNGTESIRFVAIDSQNRSSEVATLTINVSYTAPKPDNSPPTAFDSSANAQAGAETKIVFMPATDPDGDPITYKRVGGPDNGVGDFQTDANGNVTFVYTSRSDFTGTDTVRYVDFDNKGRSGNVATITINVQPAPSNSQSSAADSGGKS